MHEMGIATSVLQAVRTEAARRPGARPRKVGLRIGELAAVNPDSLRFCFDALLQGTDLETLELEIQICPFRRRCVPCGAEFEVKDYNLQCPTCGEVNSECIGGDELDLAYLEVEENEPSTA